MRKNGNCLEKELTQVQFLGQEPVVDQGLLRSAIKFYVGQLYQWGSCSIRKVKEKNGMSLSMMRPTLVSITVERYSE